MDSVVEIRNGNGKRHPKVSRRDFFFFEGKIKRTAWNLWAKWCPTKGKIGERAKWTGQCKDGCEEKANYPNNP